MFGLIWELLPGPTWVKTLQVLLVVALVVMGCFWWLFPWLADVLELSGNTVG